METLKIFWRKDLKNCVPFSVFVNGKECGTIKRGEALEVGILSGKNELYFVPNAPKFFGWKALKIDVDIHGNDPEIFLSIEMNESSASIFEGFQLRCFASKGLDVVKSEHIKKYK